MRLVADANVLLAAVTGGRAKAVLEHPGVTAMATAEVTFTEVEEYAVHLARKKRLDLELVLLAVATLPVTVVPRDQYVDAIPQARKKIGKRDPDDVDILALTMHLGWPLWSNDNDFEGTGVEWYTTAELLLRLTRAG